MTLLNTQIGRVHVSVGVSVDVRDLWVGLYWTRKPFGELWVYVCVLPCLPILVRFRQRQREREGDGMSGRLRIPDRPMTAAEFRQQSRRLAGVQTYYFDESWRRTERRSVEAGSEEEAWDIYTRGDSDFHAMIYEDECTDTDIVSLGDAGEAS